MDVKELRSGALTKRFIFWFDTLQDGYVLFDTEKKVFSLYRLPVQDVRLLCDTLNSSGVK